MTQQSADVEALLLRSIDGDMEAYGAFYEMKRPRIFRIAARICGPDEAEDVVQAVFLRLWKVLPSISKLHRIDSWLYRATVNKCIDVLRHVHQRIKLVLVDEQDIQGKDLREQFQHGELASVFNRVAEFLSPRQRAAFVLCDIEGFTSEEAAGIMKAASSTVRNLLMNARIRLRESIRTHFPEYAPPADQENR